MLAELLNVSINRWSDWSDQRETMKEAENMVMVNIKQDLKTNGDTIENLKTEIAAMETQLAKLELQHSQARILVRWLEKWLTLGSVKEAHWLRFKLTLSQRELAAKQAQQ
ncbi:MAG: hypothetical protein AB1489_28180 [Acidobacteriota bacterium]